MCVLLSYLLSTYFGHTGIPNGVFLLLPMYTLRILLLQSQPLNVDRQIGGFLFCHVVVIGFQNVIFNL